jgi:hypothetical protein
MNNFSERFKIEKYLVLSSKELSELLISSEKIFEQDTRLRDYIRVLKFENVFYLQEKTDRGEIILRQFLNVSDALKIANNRLAIYDKMWDGCGCKINYYE